MAEGLRTTMNNVVLVLDRNLMILQLNQHAESIFGDVESYVGLSVYEAFKQLGMREFVLTEVGKQFEVSLGNRLFSCELIEFDGAIYPDQFFLLIMHDMNDAKQAKLALQESQLRYHSMIAAMSEGVVVHAADGTIVECNHAAEQILGLSVDQMMGITSVDSRWRTIHEDGSPFAGESHPAMVTLQTGRSQTNVIMGVYKPDDTLSWISINSQPMVDDKQRLIGVIATFTDITERRNITNSLRNSETLYRSVVESQAELICRYTPDTTILFVNEAYCRYYGKSREELIGASFMTLVPDYQRAEIQAYVDDLLANPRTQIHEQQTLNDAGEMRWQSWLDHVICDADGNPVEVQAVGRDITESKALQQREFEIALEKEKVTILTSFIQNIAHQFRTPLATISISTFLASLEHSAHSVSESRKIHMQVERLTRLVDTLLLMATLESSNALANDEIHISGILTDLLHKLQKNHPNGPQTAYTPEPSLPIVLGDVQYLGEALHQILDNACRFTPPEKNVTVQLGVDNKNVFIEVLDRGPGIDDEILPTLFDLFWLQKKATTTSGFGLGLSVARRIIELHNGTISASNREDGGAAFRVTLPIWDKGD